MIDLIKIEFIKMKKSNIWIPIFIIPMISIVFGSGNYYFNRDILQKYWYSLWTQISLFYSMFFYAIAIAIVASYSWKMEHKSNNWNRILALPYRHSQIVVSKIISISIVSLYTQIIFILFYYITGKFIFQFQMSFPKEVFIWAGFGWFVSIAICAMQSFISMKINSFSLPVGISLVMNCIGLMFFMYKGLGGNLVYFLPNSSLILSMSPNKTEVLKLSEYIKILLSSISFTMLFVFLSDKSMKKLRD